MHQWKEVKLAVAVVFPDNRHCFLHECIICLWLPCQGLLCVHIATDATVHAASLLNWDVLPVLCLLSFPLRRSWSTDRSTVPAANRHLAPPHHLQLNFIQKYLNSSSLRSCLQPDSTLLYLRYCISAAGEANEIKSALFSWVEERRLTPQSNHVHHKRKLGIDPSCCKLRRFLQHYKSSQTNNYTNPTTEIISHSRDTSRSSNYIYTVYDNTIVYRYG